jgi:hypothetical protein
MEFIWDLFVFLVLVAVGLVVLNLLARTREDSQPRRAAASSRATAARLQDRCRPVMPCHAEWATRSGSDWRRRRRGPQVRQERDAPLELVDLPVTSETLYRLS